MASVLVTGASRGIGLELVRRYAALGWRVYATCRSPESSDPLAELSRAHERLSVHRLDVTDHGGIDALAEELAGIPLDVLVNNAGIGAGAAVIGRFDYALFSGVLATNVLGPAKMVEAFLPHVEAGAMRKIVCISSSLGSITAAKGGNYLYRTSKSALNMLMRSMAHDLAERNVILTLLSPGMVDTDFMRNARMPKIAADVSAHGLVETIDRLTHDDAGCFIRYNGETVPW